MAGTCRKPKNRGQRPSGDTSSHRSSVAQLPIAVVAKADDRLVGQHDAHMVAF